MKKANYPKISSHILFILCLSFFFASCKKTDTNLPAIDMESLSYGLIQIDDVYHNYTNAETKFLKNTSALNPQNIRDVYCEGDNLYLLLPDQFLHFDLSSGDLLNSFQASWLANFTDFSFDPVSQKAYILDNEVPQTFELSLDGGITKTIELDFQFSYSTINHLKNHSFLISVQTIPSPSFITVDFEKNEVTNFDFLKSGEKEDQIYLPNKTDSIWENYPLYVTDETSEGIMIKYLFDDNVYLCTEDSTQSEYIMNIGKERVILKHPMANLDLKDNERYRIVKFWHAPEKTYVINQKIYENTQGVFDSKTIAQFIDFEPVDGLAGFQAHTKIASLNPNQDEVFMDSEKKRFLGFKKLSEMDFEKMEQWPEQMLEAENQDDLVISIFTMK